MVLFLLEKLRAAAASWGSSGMRVVLVLVAVAMVMAGCAGPPKLGGAPNVQVLDATELPPPSASDLIETDRPYIVGPFDKLVIDVFGITELSDRKVQVDASGRISFPLVGVLAVAGNTPGQIETLLRDRLASRYVRDPQVTVNLQETVSQVVTVEGQVKKPGLYPVVGRLTLLRAIALSGGTDEFSKLNEIVIFRTVKGEQYAALYDLKAIRLGAYSDPEVYANDVVVVGESRARRIFKDVLQVVPLFTTPLIVGIDRLGR
ncbi:polysaccharide biosynthesis/export family protein [Sphingomonas sp. SRS2]|uniref:polysaccharide biosynthesis/export family protein n=1 Tax=Sphingomonas sp. SRS2 TaxID=133190 RepID=UPI001F2A675C|nr:polysaccharide biosynthesis/export family protein [Sphingomonas sp. SRS2]